MAHNVATREEHPLPAVLMHWAYLVSMVVLIFTGFYIHSPFFAGAMGTMRTLHFIFMFALIYVAIIRVYWAFFGAGSANPGERRKIRDYKHFLPERENRGKLVPIISYYLFLRRTHPATAKYNPLQKGTYGLWLLLIVAQALTGFMLWTPTADNMQAFTYALGGPDIVRIIHYLTMWGFIVTTMVHIYLSVAEGIIQLPLMFGWRETKGARGETV